MSYFKMCPICKYALTALVEDNKLQRNCRECGYKEEDTGGLIHETFINEKVSKSHEILINEFTRQDPTLPHLKTMKCPRGDCKSNGGGAEKDVIYIKYDAENLKYLYICNVCGEHWKTR